MTKEEIGLKLKAARLSIGLTQAAVAEKLGKRQQVVGHWETGYAQPDANTLILLCDIYEKTVDEVLGREVIPLSARQVAKYLTDERKRVGKSPEEVCSELKSRGYDVTPDALVKYEHSGKVADGIYKALGEIYGSGKVMEALGFVHKDVSYDPSPLTPAAQRVARLYDVADDRAREMVDVALKPFEGSVTVWKAANSDDNRPLGKSQITNEELQRLKDAPNATEL